MDEKTQLILDMLKFYSADDLKKLQTQFTKLANGIDKNAVNARIHTLYSDDELTTLKNAAKILSGTKHKIAHAKEIKHREERLKAERLAQYEKTKQKLINELIPLDDSSGMKALIWWLAVDRFFLKHVKQFSAWSNRYEFLYTLGEEVEHIKNSDRPETLKGLFVQCACYTKGLITENLWDYGTEPQREDLANIIHLIETNWIPAIKKSEAPLIDEINALMESQAFVNDIKARLNSSDNKQ